MSSREIFPSAQENAFDLPDAEASYLHHGRGKAPYTLPRLRVLLGLRTAGKACTAGDLTTQRLIAPTVLTLRWLEARTLVHSEVTRIEAAARPVPVYTLSDRGRKFINHLVATTPPTGAGSGCAE